MGVSLSKVQFPLVDSRCSIFSPQKAILARKAPFVYEGLLEFTW